jgi:hypothetical protein
MLINTVVKFSHPVGVNGEMLLLCCCLVANFVASQAVDCQQCNGCCPFLRPIIHILPLGSHPATSDSSGNAVDCEYIFSQYVRCVCR